MNQVIHNGVTFYNRQGVNSDIGVIDEVFVQNCYQFDPSYCQPHGVVIDIGANIGAFSLLVPKTIQVLAFEPQIDNFTILQTNLTVNDRTNVTARNIAIGKTGRTIMSEMGGGSFMDAPGGKEVERVSLNDITFDRCDFFKIDCEGAEYQIFDDATDETLNKIKRIAIEFHPFNKSWHDEVYARLETFFNLETITGGIVIGVKK